MAAAAISSLSGADVRAQEPIPGVASVAIVPGRGNAPVADQRVTVRVPAEGPEIEYVFSARGGTLVHARMLSERYTRDALPAMSGVPAERLAAGPIDVVTSWSPVFLPFRLNFHELSTSAASEARVLVRRASGGRIATGRVAPPERPGGLTPGGLTPGGLTIDRAVRAGDELVVQAPAAAAGTYRVARVDELGAISLTDKLPVVDVAGLTYEIWRRGAPKELWDAGPEFTRVDEGAGLPMTWVWPDPRTDTSPIFVEKRFEAGAHAYELKLRVTIHNVSAEQVKTQPGLKISAWQHPANAETSMFARPTSLYAASCYTGESLERHEFTSLYEEPQAFSTHTEWVGVDTQYFLIAAAADDLEGGQCGLEALPPPVGVTSATLWAPAGQTIKPGDAGCLPPWLPAREGGAPTCDAAFAALGHSATDPLKEVRSTWQSKREDVEGAAQQTLDDAWAAIRGRQRATYRFTLFVGPKDSDRLQASGHHLDASLDFGVLAFIAEPLLAFLKWLQGVLGHWGLAIMALTISLKLVLLPLTNKSFTQMQRMAQLRPKLDVLKQEHGDDREGFAKAQMALFKREKVNPLGGCFPMLVQMPIWFALYQTIYSSVDLYHAPLGLWIQDLSSPDPWYVMPVLLGVLMLVQSYFTPTAAGADPTQQKIMKYGMPLMFSVFMIALPAGLVLYILCNTVLTILQNIIIRRRMA